MFALSLFAPAGERLPPPRPWLLSDTVWVLQHGVRHRSQGRLVRAVATDSGKNAMHTMHKT